MSAPTGTATRAPADAAPGRPIQLDALGPRGAFRARNRLTVADVTGRPVAELSQVPSLFVQRGLSALRAARPAGPGELAEVIAGRGTRSRTARWAACPPRNISAW
ncbi:hypothetical protein [Streptomyces scabiei]|uniref:hypothetical protein n=1 Tax=Streptomyces scabiei TaxID=1930 RepID=UPI002FF0DC17